MRIEKYICWFAFLCGLGSSLYVSTPFGRIAMFDTLSFFLGPVLFVMNSGRFKRSEHRLLFLSVLWLIGTIWSNWWRAEPFSIALKGDMIVFNVWCMMVVGIVMLKKSYKGFMWFVVGASISSVISLYYFQNGAYLYFAEQAGFEGHGGMQAFLNEKQVYPLYAAMFSKGVLFPLRVLMGVPWSAVIAAQLSTGFFLLFEGGSRSSFGGGLLMAVFTFAFAYQQRILHQFMKNIVLAVLIGGSVVGLIFKAYTYLASTGRLGEYEYKKYRHEIVESESGALGSRDDIIRVWPFLKNHPIVGAGSSSTDRWGYMKSDYDINKGKMPGHSALFGSWVQNGIFGLVFWSYGLVLFTGFIRKKLLFFGDQAPFLFSVMFGMIFAVLFSPFGGYRGMVSIALALCVVSENKRWLEGVKRDSMGRRDGRG